MNSLHVDNPSANTLTILYATAEAPQRDELAALSGFPIAWNAREITAMVESTDAEQVVLVPASTGRDLTAVTQLAQALTWVKARRATPDVLLAASIFNDTYTIAYLRKQIRKATANGFDAVLFVAQAVDPFADAELFRRARLAQQYSENVEVSVCFDAELTTKADVFPRREEAVTKLRKLGAEHIAYVRADLGVWADDADHFDLCGARGISTAIELAVHNAQHAAAHGDDGLAGGLLADHAVGFAHSHGDENGHSHNHTHSHSHSHSHSHTH